MNTMTGKYMLYWLIVFLMRRTEEVSGQICSPANMVDGESYNCPDLTSAPGFVQFSSDKVENFASRQCEEGFNWVRWSAGLNSDFTLRTIYAQACCTLGSNIIDAGNIFSSNCGAAGILIGVQNYNAPRQTDVVPPNTDLNAYWGFIGYTVYVNAGVITGVSLFRTGTTIETFSAGVTNSNPITYLCAQGSTINGFSYLLTSNGNGIKSISAICKSTLCSSIQNRQGYECGCTAGSWYNFLLNTCVVCPVGAYSPTNFAVECTPCKIGGNYISSTGVTDTSMLTYTSNGGTSDSCSYNCNAGFGVSPGTGGTCTACVAGRYKSAVDKSECLLCNAGTYTSSSGSTRCTACPGNQYQPNPGSQWCYVCVWVSAAPGKYILDCTPTTESNSRDCPACSAGNILNPPCDQTSTTVPLCQACPPGTYQPNPILSGYGGPAYACQTCLSGFYSASSGAGGCLKCTRKLPSNAAWAPWTSPTSDACPIQCNAGYQLDPSGSVCTACPPGQYTPISSGVRTCVACTLSLSNGYWLRPVLFNSSWNGCPWDCNAGYYANFMTGNCIPCPAGTFTRTGVLRVSDSQAPNICLACSTCSRGATFESVPCTSLTDRQCGTCTNRCNTGFYYRPCTLTADSTCIACKSTCAAGQYMSGACTGTVCAHVLPI